MQFNCISQAHYRVPQWLWVINGFQTDIFFPSMKLIPEERPLCSSQYTLDHQMLGINQSRWTSPSLKTFLLVTVGRMNAAWATRTINFNQLEIHILAAAVHCLGGIGKTLALLAMPLRPTTGRTSVERIIYCRRSKQSHATSRMFCICPNVPTSP